MEFEILKINQIDMNFVEYVRLSWSDDQLMPKLLW